MSCPGRLCLTADALFPCRYGREVLGYIWSVKHVSEDGKYLTHDPMCELFPTEVSSVGIELDTIAVTSPSKSQATFTPPPPQKKNNPE
jgi:hypothetical protein